MVLSLSEGLLRGLASSRAEERRLEFADPVPLRGLPREANRGIVPVWT